MEPRNLKHAVFFIQQRAQRASEKSLCLVIAVKYAKQVCVFSQSKGSLVSEKVPYMR